MPRPHASATRVVAVRSARILAGALVALFLSVVLAFGGGRTPVTLDTPGAPITLDGVEMWLPTNQGQDGARPILTQLPDRQPVRAGSRR